MRLAGGVASGGGLQGRWAGRRVPASCQGLSSHHLVKPHWRAPSPVLGGYSTGLGSFLPLPFYLWGLAAGFHLVFFQLFLFCL